MVMHTAFAAAEVPLSEPEIVPCIYLNGMSANADRAVVIFIGWQNGEGERIIRTRFAVQKDVLLRMLAEIGALEPAH